jgi:hypothetical protein
VKPSADTTDESAAAEKKDEPEENVVVTVLSVPESPAKSKSQEPEEPLQSLFAPKQEPVKEANAEAEEKEEDDDDFDVKPPTGVRQSLIFMGGVPRSRYERLSITNGGRRSSCFKSFDSIAATTCQPIVHELIDIHGDDRHWLEKDDAIRDFAVLYCDFQTERCGDAVANNRARANLEARKRQSIAAIGTLQEVDEE